MTTTARHITAAALALLLLAALLVVTVRPAQAAPANREYMVTNIVQAVADVRDMDYATMVSGYSTTCFNDLGTVNPVADRRAICFAKTHGIVGGSGDFNPEAGDDRKQLARVTDRAGKWLTSSHSSLSSSHPGGGWHSNYDACNYYSDMTCNTDYADNIGNVYHNGWIDDNWGAKDRLTCDTNPVRFCPNANITDTSVLNAAGILDRLDPGV